jgi:predicted dehydrogenase
VILLRVLLIGAGWVARRHRDAVLAAGDRVVWVVDPDVQRAAGLAGHPAGASVCASIAEWDGEADAAIVASPSAVHLEQAIALVRRGLPVLVEKPHRLPGQRADDLLAEAERRGVPVQVGMSTRFGDGMRSLFTAVRSGALGDLAWAIDRIWFQLEPDQIAPWYFDRRASGGGVLVTNGVHALDRLSWLLNEPLELLSVDLRTLAAGRAVEDAAALQLITPSGIGVAVSLLWAPYAVPPSAIRVTGTRGTGVVRGDGSWSIAVDGGEQRGPATGERVPFERQWAAFRSVAMGDADPEPGVRQVEQALTLVEEAYALGVPA